MAEESEADGQAEAKTFEEFQCHSTTLIRQQWLLMAVSSPDFDISMYIYIYISPRKSKTGPKE